MAITCEQKEKLKTGYLASINKVGAKDVNDAYQKGKSKIDELKDNVPNKLKALWADIMAMISILGDYISGKYPDLPWKTVAAITGAVLYFVSPVDVIPDFIPIIGYLDDAFVIALAIDFIRDDLAAYRAWKEQRDAI